ncbi:MAG: serine/threonine protein kinase [Gammaproteobacteria bacterium]|nr:serine/threonine protein kinase [Gammaproteobacteria bacterium]
MTDDPEAPPYAGLTPDLVIGALEATGRYPDGRVLALNSYENRVYQIGVEEGPPLVAKFYRPGRWSDACIVEEHQFALSLAAEEIPVVAPLVSPGGTTLHHFHGFRYSLFPRQGGRWPELEQPGILAWIGRFLGRIHRLGASSDFHHRPSINPPTDIPEASRYLLDKEFIPVELMHRFERLYIELQQLIEAVFSDVSGQWIRLHGDCHPGNLLWADNGPHFVDLDDCRMGPAIQDLWMLLSGDRDEMTGQLTSLLEGYELFMDMDRRQLRLIEPLRTIRMVRYAAWLGERWNDPAFPSAFPWFNTHQYWQHHLTLLEQQLSALAQPPLQPC